MCAWIYGHTHNNICMELNGTKLISNQKGHHFDETNYDESFVIKF